MLSGALTEHPRHLQPVLLWLGPIRFAHSLLRHLLDLAPSIFEKLEIFRRRLELGRTDGKRLAWWLGLELLYEKPLCQLGNLRICPDHAQTV